MNRLNRIKQVQVIAALAEGSSINSIVRMTGVSKVTILKLLADLGPKWANHQDRILRNLKCKRVQCDEIWQFVYAKAKNVPAEKRGQFGYGDIWTWVAIDADTKLVLALMIGNCDALSAELAEPRSHERRSRKFNLSHYRVLLAISSRQGNAVPSVGQVPASRHACPIGVVHNTLD